MEALVIFERCLYKKIDWFGIIAWGHQVLGNAFLMKIIFSITGDTDIITTLGKNKYQEIDITNIGFFK